MKDNIYLAIQILLALIGASIVGGFIIFIWLPWIQENRKTTTQPIQQPQETPAPRFIYKDFPYSRFIGITEITDTETKVTYLIYETTRSSIVLSKEPTSATKTTLLEELK
jgi:hypothetical protein